MFVPLGGVLYANYPDNMRDARLWNHASGLVAAAALTSRAGGAAASVVPVTTRHCCAPTQPLWGKMIWYSHHGL